ncbi:MAG TPA: FAD-dependent oxidoreductase [Firmicutes bacterium]|nr:FAD-dependent oxidoreductase [Bacillota bacterium]
MAKKILIIGAGAAGLSAGVHALRNGYDVEIFEKERLPGGLPGSMLTGRHVVQLICSRERQSFLADRTWKD